MGFTYPIGYLNCLRIFEVMKGDARSMKQIKILAIGNSFSEDATHYLHQIAKCSGVDTKVVNLYIGSCSLETHGRNIRTKEKAYRYELNGDHTDRMVSIDEILLEDSWDYIVTQQVSYLSGELETYYPWLTEVISLCKETNPDAKIYLHKTWAYEIDSQHGGFARYHNSQQEMYEKITQCSDYVAQEEHIELIPCGDVIQAVRKIPPFVYEEGGLSLCRDGFHMSFIYGRYLLAATWAVTLLGIDLIENTYLPKTIWETGVDAQEEILKVIKELVCLICKQT